MNADVATLDRLLSTRYSCRGFRPDPVPHATIEAIFALAQRTASWCNAQPWEAIVTEGEATERFRAAMEHAAQHDPTGSDFAFPASYPGVLGERRKQGGIALYNAVGVERGDKAGWAAQGMRNFSLFGAPHAAVITTEALLGVYGAIDCGAFVSTVLLAAQAHGVASIAQGAIASRSDAVRAHFNLPENRKIICGISFGYADADHPANSFRMPRAALDEVVRFER